MRVVIQRVSKAEVSVENEFKAKIGNGLVLLLGVEHEDKQEDIEWLTTKIVNMRIFYDDEGVKNLSVRDIDGEILVVSQFTLHARIKKGNRPAYLDAASPEKALKLYNTFVLDLNTKLGKKVETGTFGSYMQIAMINDGPVTIIADSKNRR